MAVYRIYLVHDDGRLEADASFYCVTDGEALSHLAPAPRADIRTELWQGGRFIGAAGQVRRSPYDSPRPQA